jgi:molybdate transport system substrate-binding protein
VRRLLLVLLLLLTGCSAQATPRDRPLLVAAASDLQPAFEELGREYERQTGRPVTFTFGSSGQLAEQLKNGAPYEVFASASVRYVEEVLRAGRGDPASQADYALGRLAVWTPDEPVALSGLAQPRFARIALANPEHAPYGVAARQALDSSGLLPTLRERLVYGENVSDTLRLATSGNADAAVVALSLVQSRPGGRWTAVPADAHAPLRQALVVTAEEPRAKASRAFADLVTGRSGRAALARHGFAPPAG